MSVQRPNRTIQKSKTSLGLIARHLDASGVASDTGRVTFQDASLPDVHWDLIDSEGSESDILATCESLLHILHVENEDDSTVDVDGVVWPIHPGDSLFMGESSRVLISGGVLMLQVHCDRSGSISFLPPSHGTESFDGFNRRTVFEAGRHFTFERWKLTTHQEIVIEPGCAMAMVGLFGNISCIEGDTIETLHAGESLVATHGRVRLIPDGLAYIALILVDVP